MWLHALLLQSGKCSTISSCVSVTRFLNFVAKPGNDQNRWKQLCPRVMHLFNNHFFNNDIIAISVHFGDSNKVCYTPHLCLCLFLIAGMSFKYFLQMGSNTDRFVYSTIVLSYNVMFYMIYRIHHTQLHIVFQQKFAPSGRFTKLVWHLLRGFYLCKQRYELILPVKSLGYKCHVY